MGVVGNSYRFKLNVAVRVIVKCVVKYDGAPCRNYFALLIEDGAFEDQYSTRFFIINHRVNDFVSDAYFDFTPRIVRKGNRLRKGLGKCR